MAYIGVQPAEAYTSFAVQHFTTSATTSYTLDHSVANENEIALFINNVRQQPGSSYAYTASGTTLTLSAATSASDTMYCVFIGKAVQTVTPNLNPVTIDSGTVATFNRTSSFGDIISIQKDGTEAGSIGAPQASVLSIQSTGDRSGMQFGSTNVYPRKNNALSDNTVDLGQGSYRWQDLYLGGNIYLGGTGSANALDDYEEGTHQPTVTGDGGGTATLDSGSNTLAYTKIGRTVHLTGTIQVTSVSGCSGNMRMTLPFTCLANSNGTGYHGVMVPTHSVNAAGDLGVAFQLEPNAASGLFFGINDNSGTSAQLTTGYYRITLTYQTN